jgi:hypothetical protein
MEKSHVRKPNKLKVFYQIRIRKQQAKHHNSLPEGIQKKLPKEAKSSFGYFL